MLLILAGLLLASCGWHLRGNINAALAFDSIFIKGAGDDQVLRLLLKNAFERSDVAVVGDVNAAEVTLALSPVKKMRRVLSVSSDGSVEEYRLFYSLKVSATRADDKAALSERRLEQMRIYTYDKNAALAKGGEEELLYSEMRREVVQAILRLLKTFNLDPNPNVTK